jgi:signal transduction histidine kinase
LWDPARRRAVWGNAAALDLFGARDPGRLAARPLPEIDAAMVAAAAAGVHGAPAMLRAADGALAAGRLSTTAAALPDGRLGLRAIFRPGPARRADEALRAAAFEAAPVAMAVLDADGAALARNAAFRALDPAAAARLGAKALPDPDGASPLRLLAGMPSETGAISAEALARIAHEFRSPLTAVLGFAEFLREQFETAAPERARGYLDDLSAAAERVRRLADDILAIGQAGARLRIDVVAVDRLVAEALRLAAPAAARRGVRLGAPPAASVEALADGEALGRAILNLLDNAVRHGRAGGAATVAVEAGPGGLAITVADDGPGLDPAALAVALEPWGRATSDQGRAGGLGLPIVREIAEAHGGALEIETAPGQGFVARLLLPPACAARARRRHAAA